MNKKFKLFARQGKARQGKRQKYSINIDFNHNGNIITLIKFFVNRLIKNIMAKVLKSKEMQIKVRKP